LHRHIFRQDAVLNETDHAVLRILVKLLWHVPDFPIYSNGTKPRTLQPALEGLALHVVDAAGDHDVGFTQRNLAA
ncbi:hypothetical protein ACL1CG_13325, partial [Corynebacterium striatum]